MTNLELILIRSLVCCATTRSGDVRGEVRLEDDLSINVVLLGEVRLVEDLSIKVVLLVSIMFLLVSVIALGLVGVVRTPDALLVVSSREARGLLRGGLGGGCEGCCSVILPVQLLPILKLSLLLGVLGELCWR